MPSDPAALRAANERLQSALERLEASIERFAERDARVRGVDEEVQRMTADRARLAGELDLSVARARRLETTNREVSARLVSAMETIRSVLERRKEA